MEPTLMLTTEQIEFYRENDFLAVDSITTPEEIARLRLVYGDLFARRVSILNFATPSPPRIDAWDYTPTPYWGIRVKKALTDPANVISTRQ